MTAELDQLPQRLDPPFHLSRNGLFTEGTNRWEVPSIRMGTHNRLPWVVATGSADTRERKAATYLQEFDHDIPFRREMPEVTLAKVVCNLRNFHQQDEEMTVKLIRSLYNNHAGFNWSPDGIRLAWKLVEKFTPSLGLADEQAKAKQWAAFLENEVIDLLAWTKPGGRVSGKDLLDTFLEWNPELEPHLKENSNTFSRAVKAVTGLTQKSSNCIYYWIGIHLPTAEELNIINKTAA